MQYQGLEVLLAAPLATDGGHMRSPLQALIARFDIESEAALGQLLDHCVCRRALAAVWAAAAGPALRRVLARDGASFLAAHAWGYLGAKSRGFDDFSNALTVDSCPAHDNLASTAGAMNLARSAEVRAVLIVAAWALVCRYLLLAPVLGALLGACLAVGRRLAALAAL